MAEIRPFRAWRYNPALEMPISELTSPLFDVVSEKQRKKLYQNQYNSIHLSVPQPTETQPNPAQAALAYLEKWKKEGVILQDEKPAIYVYYQYFSLPSRFNSKTYCRKGFISFIKTYDWEEKIILRHENTIPAAVNDRIELLETTLLHASPTHGLYTLEQFDLEPYMDAAIQNPLYETEDYQGVREVLAKIDDPQIVAIFVEKIKGQQIILADGHHRYESSLVLRQKKMAEKLAKGETLTGSEAFHYHLMYLTNSCSNDLRILPTHRLIRQVAQLDEREIVAQLAQDFDLKNIENSSDLNEIIWGKKHTFGLIFKENTYLITLKKDKIQTLAWNFPIAVKELDLTILHYFLIEKVLGIKGKEQRSSPHISFERNFTECVTQVMNGQAQLACITNGVTMEEVKAVCQSGYTMPQKSTYFYPKAICGFVFGSIAPEDFGN
ncbi:DUF1015 domain-containing protein [Hugenholtzia roseola]|uniref:DUF1015 domain-containing protein n=1 Tax=Hugenholtzia roseola TaxID=1002 RepID=UPI00041636F8|nr:DUF1015 domain-containing protein [Hugenholtzia roseola]